MPSATRRPPATARIAGAACAAGLFLTVAAAALEVPYLSGRIVDQADLLPAADEARIEERLAAIEERFGAQMAVLTVATLGDEPIEEYSLRVVETWKLGRAEQDDGLLLLVARDDRKMRVEVGYGLEPVITDLAAKRIVDTVLAPRFRAGDFPGGIEAAVVTVEDLLGGEENALPPPAEARPFTGIEPWPVRLGTLVFFLATVGLFSLVALGTPGCAGWFLYAFLIPFWATFPMVILGPRIGMAAAVGWIVLFPIVRTVFKTAAKATSWWPTFGGSGGGWSSSSGWGGGGGFSGGGGGFSGGGGSFGGGGASGSW